MINKELQDIYTGKRREAIIETIEIEHISSGLHRFYCKAFTQLDITLEDGTVETFEPSSFACLLPKYEENDNMDINITFGLIGFQDLEIIEDIIRNTTDNITCKYRIYTESNLSAPQTQLPFKFDIKNISLEGSTITFTGSLLLNVSDIRPSELYTLDKFPAMRGLD